MNIPQIYLVEPYNAYAPKGRKKHLHEILEEQALLARIMAEQQALQEAAAQRTSNTLPPQAPDTATPTIVGNTSGEGAAGGRGSGAGGGGTPAWDFWNPSGDTVNFNRSPSSGAGPLTVNFTNLTTTPQFDSYKWEFTKEGVTVTSTDINPVMVFQTGSTDPVVVTASLQVTNSVTGAPGGRSPNVYTLVSVPVVTAAFTYTTTSNVAPFSVSFVNTSATDNGQPLTYLWTFAYDNGTTTVLSSSRSTTPTSVRVDSGSYTASLQATGSYGIASIFSASKFIPAPSLGVTFTVVSSSNISPSLVTLTPTVTYNGNGTYANSGRWLSGEFMEDGVTQYNQTPYDLYPVMSMTYDTRSWNGTGFGTGSFTASLAVTESSYGLTAFYTQSFYLALPTVLARFITQSFGFGGAEDSYMEPVSMSYTSSVFYNGNAPATVLWDFGSASFVSTADGVQTGTSASVGPHFRADYGPGNYTASLQLTGSYGIASIERQMFQVNT